MVAMRVLETRAERRVGSSPSLRTKQSDCSSVGLEQQPSKLWVGGSNPSSQAKYTSVVQRIVH